MTKTAVSNQLKINELTAGEWYYIHSDIDKVSEFTGIMYEPENNILHIEYSGHEFEEPFQFWVKLNEELVNMAWYYQNDIDYTEQFEYKGTGETLSWVDDIMCIPYQMLHYLDRNKYKHLMGVTTDGA